MTATSILVAGRYRLVSELGRGGMGVVWEAFDELLHRSVAVKEVQFPATLPEADRERLAGRTLQEARAVAKVDTPAAVRVYDIVEQDARPWIVMELLRGTTLSSVVAERGGLPEAEVARVGLALVDALEAAHAAGVLHRDVKPSNVLLAEDGRVALTDFGIATVEGEAGEATTGVVLGSPSYVAPERLSGERPTAAADYWALGATLWTALEGRPPYAGATPYAVLSAVSTSEPPGCTHCSPSMRVLVHALMARDPLLRPSVDAVRSALSELAEAPDGQPEPVAPTEVMSAAVLSEHFDRTTVLDARPADPSAPARPVPRVVSPSRQPSRTPQLIAAALVVVVLAGLAGLLLAQHDGSPSGTAAPKSSASPATSTRSTPSVRASAPAGTAGVPAGFHAVSEDGWTVAVPDGWTRSSASGGTRFSDPAGGRYFLVASRDPAGPSAVGAWRDQEKSFRKSHDGYERIRLESISQPGASDAADWEFRYSDGGARLHALDRARVVDGVGYAVYVQSRDGQWEQSQPLFQQVQDSFRAG
jgi:serine/threonine protein kinase